MADTITPPGKPRILPCPECKGVAGHECLDCSGTCCHVMRTCPRCGDPGWDYVNGTDDRDGMACRINCGYQWTADHPRLARPSAARQYSLTVRSSHERRGF